MQKLARIYRDGYIGNCAFEPANRRSRSCTMVAQDAEKAAEFARLACAARKRDSCLIATPPERGNAALRSARKQCQQGSMQGCDDFLTRYPLTPLSDLLPKAAIQRLCDTGNASVCLHSARDELLRALTPPDNGPVPPLPQRSRSRRRGLASM